jgi:hypothetical protein
VSILKSRFPQSPQLLTLIGVLILTVATNQQSTSATQKQGVATSKKSHLNPIASEKPPQALPLSNIAFYARDFGAASVTMSFCCICFWLSSPTATGYPITATIKSVRFLQICVDEYILARDLLIEKDLIAFDGSLFQVLSLPQKPPSSSTAVLKTAKDMQTHDPATIDQLIANCFGKKT